jgi:hypothetical protein
MTDLNVLVHCNEIYKKIVHYFIFKQILQLVCDPYGAFPEREARILS